MSSRSPRPGGPGGASTASPTTSCAFYFDVLTRYRTEIDAGLGPTILQVLLDSLDDHQGERWEAAFRQHVRRLTASGEFSDRIVAVGPLWTADGHNETDLHRKAAALPGAPGDLRPRAGHPPARRRDRHHRRRHLRPADSA
ncbi:MAG: DUF234 domain-containing protein [Pseudonocardiaceae bacterium]